ncbi:MAG: D-Ala-D-Ala carboxypeptidase family metallohydrolase [Rhodobacterales bacterium]|nr:D-Ala-D-Ala carboxypeptidase family metallohydrolase [Rhodobacterales bacterium]MDX5411754.1 D-Ala-D-Ala carboxypeptidase family metallohydrolase [Rhodobacterales bacterium]
MKRRYAHFSQVDMKDWRWPSFSPREIASKGEGELLVDDHALDKLQALRERLGKPMLITSAYRSVAHNRRVGGAKNSMHMQGIAFDVRMENHDPHEFEAAARAVGFTGFGYYPKSGFMHIDTGPARSWGKPWPVTETGLPIEAKTQPEKLSEDRQTQAAVGASTAGVAAVALEHLPAASGLIGNLAPTAQIIAVIAAAALIGYLLLSRAR